MRDTGWEKTYRVVFWEYGFYISVVILHGFGSIKRLGCDETLLSSNSCEKIDLRNDVYS